MIKTELIILKQWQEKDLESFKKLNAGPKVSAYFPRPLTLRESDRSVKTISDQITQK